MHLKLAISGIQIILILAIQQGWHITPPQLTLLYLLLLL